MATRCENPAIETPLCPLAQPCEICNNNNKAHFIRKAPPKNAGTCSQEMVPVYREHCSNWGQALSQI
jgi:hypothetical protein